MIGDLDGDGILGVGDIHVLVANFGNPAYDLTENGLTNRVDLNYWVEHLFGTALGDANLDHAVDLIDLSMLATNFGTAGSWEQGEFNGDNTIDLVDLSILAAHFGYTTPVPEPASLLVLVAGLLSAIGYRDSIH